MIDENAIRQRWEAVGSALDEYKRRLFAAIEVRTAGRGGLAVVSRITGLVRSTINRGEDDLDAEPLPEGAIRRPGGGRCAVSEVYPGLITADCGRSNGARVRLWKCELQKFSDETGLVIYVHHYPPGTSKWNKIEHRLFCHITQTWRARPLTSRLAVVESIAATTTKTGLKVECALDTRCYQKGIKVTDAEMKSLNITGDEFHPEWNYSGSGPNCPLATSPKKSPVFSICPAWVFPTSWLRLPWWIGSRDASSANL